MFGRVLLGNREFMFEVRMNRLHYLYEQRRRLQDQLDALARDAGSDRLEEANNQARAQRGIDPSPDDPGRFHLFGGHRCFYPDVDHAAVARWLRAQAKTGFVYRYDPAGLVYRDQCTCGVNLPEADHSVSLMFTRDCIAGELTGWHLSVCCVTRSGYRGYQPAEGGHWAELVFGFYRSRLVEFDAMSSMGQRKAVHHFRLDCDWNVRTDPAVTLEGLDKA